MAITTITRRPSDLMDDDPRMSAFRERAANRTSEDAMRAYGGGTGTSGVPVGTVIVEQPGAATRAMTGAGTGSEVRTIDSLPVQPTDTRWTGEKVQSLMGLPAAAGMSPEGVGRAAAVAVKPATVAEQLLGPVQSSGFRVQGSQPVTGNSEPGTLFYDENHFQKSSTQPKQFVKMQADYWTNKVFADARATRPGFSNLDEYDAWFRTIPGKPSEFGDAMKEAYLNGMPENIKNEFMERKMEENTQRRESGQVQAFNAAVGPAVGPKLTTMAEARAAALGSEIENRNADQENAKAAAARAERNMQILEEQNKRDQANDALTAEDRKRKQSIYEMAQADVKAGIDAGDPGYVMSADGKFYRNRGDLDPVTGGYNWKPYNPWTLTEELGAAMRPGAAATKPAPAAGPDVTGALQTQAQFVAAFKEAHGREPSATELQKANGKYWR